MNINITNDIKYVGVDDHEIDLFEGMYIVPNGMAYNSYVILDEKICVMDTVEVKFGEQWMANLDGVLAGKEPAYLVVQHVEPDHSANICAFMDRWPGATLVCSKQAVKMIENFYGNAYQDRYLVVGDGDSLELGSHKLNFVGASMVHWPEVIMTYDETDKVLFSADAFGKFGAQDYDDPEGWACEARRYYFGIVGKFGAQVQTVLKKLDGVEINAICALHGPILTEDLGYYLDTYNTWSSYGVESEGVVVVYTSVYGHMAEAAQLLADTLEKKGCPKVVLTDLARSDWAENVEDAFRYGKIVFATTTYNGGMFPTMREFIDHLTERNYQNRTIGFMESGTWAPAAAKAMRAAFENSKDITYTENTVKILSALNDESRAQIEALAEELC